MKHSLYSPISTSLFLFLETPSPTLLSSPLLYSNLL